MASTPNYASTPRIQSGVLTLNDYSRTTPTNFATIFTAGSNGSRLDYVDYAVSGTSIATSLRLWLYNGTSYSLFKEFLIPATTVSSTVAAVNTTFSSSTNTDSLPLVIPSGTSVVASVNDVSVVIPASNGSLSGNTTPTTVATGIVPLTTAGTAYTASITTLAANSATVASNQTTVGAAFLALTVYPYTPTIPTTVTLTSNSATSNSGVTFTIRGQLPNGTSVTETLTGPAASPAIVYSANVYSVIDSITSSATATSISAGNASSASFIGTVGSQITFTAPGNISGASFVVRGITPAGISVVETVTGPNNSTVSSVNTYKFIGSVVSSGSVGPITLGTPAQYSSVSVIGRGGDF